MPGTVCSDRERPGFSEFWTADRDLTSPASSAVTLETLDDSESQFSAFTVKMFHQHNRVALIMLRRAQHNAVGVPKHPWNCDEPTSGVNGAGGNGKGIQCLAVSGRMLHAL